MFKIVCMVALSLPFSAALHAQSLVKKCMPASYEHAKAKTYDSYSDDFGSYLEFQDVEFGVSLAGEGYVGVSDDHVMVTDIRFRDPKGKQVALRPDDLALIRGVAYSSKVDRAVICVLSPFAGIGSSGSFQSVAGLIAVRKPHGQARIRVEGAIVRVR
jgi:hypothetical protein